MRSKKMCAALLAAVYVMTGLCSCGNKKSDDSSSGGKSETAIESVTDGGSTSDNGEYSDDSQNSGKGDDNTEDNGDNDKPEQQVYTMSVEGYELEEVVVLSRHNIRSPLSSKDSVLGKATPYEWFEWSSSPSELSERGGAAETVMGQYFRKWLEEEGLFTENYQPAENEVRIYSNSKQRTIATSNYFKTGLLPTADVDVEWHMEFDTMDPVFTPQLTFVSDEYNAAVTEQVFELFSDDIKNLADNYELIADIIDLKDSEAYADGTLTGFSTDDLELVLEENKEPGMKGSLKTGCSISDALVLQYYEQPDDNLAAFGHQMSYDDWCSVSAVKDLYGDVLFTAPLVAPNVAHPLLKEIKSELNTEGRKFTFLCGHDSNVGSVLAALGVEDYRLPDTIEAKTPIGCKIVFCKWKKDGSEFISCNLVYQSSEQLRNMSLLDLNNTPIVFALSFEGMEKNADGLYTAEEMNRRFDDAIEEYDVIIDEYSLAAAA